MSSWAKLAAPWPSAQLPRTNSSACPETRCSAWCEMGLGTSLRISPNDLAEDDTTASEAPYRPNATLVPPAIVSSIRSVTIDPVPQAVGTVTE